MLVRNDEQLLAEGGGLPSAAYGEDVDDVVVSVMRELREVRATPFERAVLHPRAVRVGGGRRSSMAGVGLGRRE